MRQILLPSLYRWAHWRKYPKGTQRWTSELGFILRPTLNKFSLLSRNLMQCHLSFLCWFIAFIVFIPWYHVRSAPWAMRSLNIEIQCPNLCFYFQSTFNNSLNQTFPCSVILSEFRLHQLTIGLEVEGQESCANIKQDYSFTFCIF